MFVGCITCGEDPVCFRISFNILDSEMFTTTILHCKSSTQHLPSFFKCLQNRMLTHFMYFPKRNFLNPTQKRRANKTGNPIEEQICKQEFCHQLMGSITKNLPIKNNPCCTKILRFVSNSILSIWFHYFHFNVDL